MSVKLYRRPESPHWHAAITVPGRDRIRTSCRTTDKKRARALAEALEAKEWKRRTDGEESTLTFSEAVMLYRKDGKPTRFLLPLVKHFKDRSIASFTIGDVRAAAAAIYPTASAATWNRQVITPVRSVINHAADRGLAERADIKKFRELRPVRKAAPAADWLPAFIASAEPRVAALALFNRVTGARVGQAISIEWKAVDLSSGTVVIPAAKGHPERRAYLTPELIAMLANLPGYRAGRVFGFRSRRRVYDPWRAACDAAGIPYVPTHPAGRRGFATDMARAGVDPKTAADLGGWATMRIMLEAYVDSAASREVVNRVFSSTLTTQSTIRQNRKIEKS